MAKSKTFPASNEERFASVIGVDIGYGDVKGANSHNTVLIPSIIGSAPVTRYSDEWSKDDGDIVFDDQGTWYIGKKALMHSKNVRYIKDRGRTTLPDYRRLIHVAFGRLHPHNSQEETTSVSVATGLPVAHMGDAVDLKEMLEGQHRIHTKFADGVYSVENVAVMPQPYGCLFYNTLDDYGNLINQELSDGKVMVIDIGRFTTNVITVEDMAYLERASDSRDFGVYVIEQHIQHYLEAKYKWTDVRPDVIRKAIEDERHSTIIDGDMIDLSDAFTAGCEDLAEQVLGLVAELTANDRGFKARIIGGGGGILLEDWIKQRYPKAYLTEDPIMSNAIGFARYGRRKWVK
jgi:hypothetical protein